MEQFRAWAVTHPGTVRDHNEDAYVNRPDLGLWAVADGAGGHDAGEVASGLIATALDSIPLELNAEETLTQVRMRMAATHAALRERAARQGNGMIASTVVVLIARHGHFACLWAGDSRAYLLRDGALARVSRDHSLVQELVDGGQITRLEAGSDRWEGVVRPGRRLPVPECMSPLSDARKSETEWTASDVRPVR